MVQDIEAEQFPIDENNRLNPGDFYAKSLECKPNEKNQFRQKLIKIK